MAAASMLVNVTHIDDSVRGRQGPCVYFWGSTHDRSLYLTMELYLESIRQHLESKVPPMNLSDLDSNEIFCVLINHRWHRATVPELKFNRTGMLEVYCVDSGKTHTVPLIFLRTLDIPGYEAENIRDCPPLASKFILADAVAPFGLGTHTRQWSDLAMTFLKIHVENEIWKAIPMAMYGEHQGVRLFDSNNQLLASALVQQGLGVAAQSYHEALAMCETMEKQPSFMKPAFYSYPVMKLFPAGCNMSSLSGPLRPNFAIPSAQQNLPKVSTRTYVTNNLPLKERYDVVVTHISEGPFQFFVRMKSETKNLQEIRKHLDSMVPTPFQGTPLGSACVAVSPSDQLFHRGLITGMKDFGTPSCKYSVFFVDIGTQIPIDRALIYDIPDELLVPCLCAYRVSLFGVENISKLPGLNRIFAALVNKESNLKAEVEDDERQQISLYISGRSICDILAAIYSNPQDNSPISSVTSTSTLLLSTVAVPFSVVQMPPLNLAAEESVFVTDAGTSGYFFGQLEEIRLPNSKTGCGLKDLNDMADELKNAYSTQANPPLLYAGSESRLGHHGVVVWEEDGVYYRVRVTKEMGNEAEILFIDFGNTIVVPRNTILSPIKSLTRFCHPPYGIHCKLEEGVALPSQKWKHLIVDRWIKVKIGRCVEGIYSVTFTSDLGNGIIATKIQNAVSRPNAVELVNKQKKQAESAVLESVAKILTSIPISEDRLIKSSNNGNFSVTIKNSPCIDEKISETTVIETDKRLSQPAFIESDPPRDLRKIDDGSNQDNVETEAKETNLLEPEILPQTSEMEPLSKGPEFSSKLIPGAVSTSTTIPKQSSSVGNEIPKVLNQEEKQELTENLPAVKSDIESATQELKEVNDAPGRSRPLTYHQQQLSYPEQIDVPINQQVEVVYVNDPSSFYLQLLESCTVLAQLGTNLNTVYSDESKPSIVDPKVGSACVVQYEEDNGWYRGQILKFCDPLGTTVLFVDYGNTQLVPVEKIKSIDEEFIKLPPLAYHCRLDGVDASRDWTAEEKKKFEGRIMAKNFSATFTFRDSEGKYPVRLVEETKKGNIAINEEFGAPNFTNIPPPSSGYTSRSVPDKPISVFVSCCVDPFRFYLSPIADAYQNQLEELEKFYSSLSPNDLHEDQPSLGLPCVARFAEDGRYYRSQILSIVDDIADILFVDYGNQQKTPLSELKRITPCFMEFPQMTWQCKLKGVKKASPICPDFQKHIDTCFATNEELSALFHPASPGENNGVFEVDLTVPKIGDASQYLIEKNVVERVSLEADVELAAQDVNFSPQQIISTNAITLCFKSPAEFWIQLDPNSANDFMERLDKLALDPQFLNKKDFIPSVGKPCLAFYEIDERWYRAKVEAVKEDCVTICYVDYGESCDVKTFEVRGLPKEFAQQPALAFKCCQDGFENFSESASKIFEEIVMDLESFSVKFLKLVDGVLCVRLSHGESDLGELCSPVETEPLPEEPVISGAVVQAESLVQDVAVTNNLAVNDVFGTLLLFTEYTSLPVSETPMEVCVSWFYNPGQFFLSPVNLSKYQNCLEELEKFYSSLSPEELMEEQPILGLPCVARFTEDDRYYRSEILSIRGEIAELLFVDFGNKQNTPLSQVKRMVPRFLGFPKLAWNCKLEGVKKMTTFSINPEAKKYLAACFLTGETVTASFHSTGSDGNKEFFEVDLAVPEIGDVSQYLIRNNILERISHPKLPAQNLEFVSNQIISTHAVASYIKSPTEFWVQLDPVSLELIADLIDKLVIDPVFTNENNFTVFKGKPCLAFFPDDQRWYRATVEAVNGDTAQVFYFDYGNNCAVKMSDLRQLPIELSKQAALAFKCSLDGSKGFSKDAIAAFETLMFGLPAFTIECLDVIDGVLRVRLYSSSGINLIKQLSSGKLSLPPIPEEESVESIPEVVFTELEGKISYYSSNIFWFHLERNKVEMKEMEDQLNQLCKRDANFFSDKHKPKNNLIYGIKHPKFVTWRRGLLYKIFTNTASVYFLDYGDSQVVSFAEIFALPDQFQCIPPFAIRCRVKTSWKPVELTPVVLEKLNGVCFYPQTPCKLVCGRRENDKVSFIDSFFVGEHEILELLCTGLTRKECGQSVTLVQCINLMGEKGWKGGDWCSGLRSSSVIQFVDLLGR